MNLLANTWLGLRTHDLGCQIVWSDERKFNLDGPDGYGDLGQEPRVFSKQNFGGGVMVSAGFSGFGKTALATVSNM